MPREPDPNAFDAKFWKMGATKFARDVDPLEAEEWIVQTKNVFEVMVCIGRPKVSLAGYMF